MDATVYTPGQIADIHRKLSSLQAQLGDEHAAFLTGPLASSMSEPMVAALRAFQEHAGIEASGVCDPATWQRLNDEAGSLYNEVWQYELDALRRRSGVPDGVAPADEDQVIATAHAANLAGLAFSGGGIRSATFNLGVLQALAEHKMLRDFDYLSTVSGGGYIGGWFSAWLKRAGSIEQLEAELTPCSRAPGARHEPGEISFLRQYSNYLTPKTGLFSADTWSLLATYIRNTMLNMCILVMLMAAALMLPRLLVAAVAKYGEDYAAWFGYAACALALWAVFCIAISISTLPQQGKRNWLRGQSQTSVISFIVVPLMLSAFSASIALWHQRTYLQQLWDGLDWPPTDATLLWLLLPGLCYFVAWSLGWALAQYYNRKAYAARPRFGLIPKEGLGHLLCALAGFAVGTTLLLATMRAIGNFGFAKADAPGHAVALHLVALGMPLILALFGVTMILCVGLVGRMYSEKSREWWSRQGGWTTVCTLVWLAACGISLYAPPLLAFFAVNAENWHQALVGSTWVGATASGLLLGRSQDTGKTKEGKPWLDWIAAMAPLVFSLGALCIIATLSYRLTMGPPVPDSSAAKATAPATAVVVSKDLHETFQRYTATSADASGRHIALVMLALFLGGLGLACRVDINKFSLYMMYRNRLVRAYLGALNPERRPHPFTGFDDNDDPLMDSFLTHGNGKLQRPYHLLNTTVNLVSGKELAWQTRKAAGFSFAPGFVGFEMPAVATPGVVLAHHEAARGCFRKTSQYHGELQPRQAFGSDDDGGIRLGMAMAVSGAAVNPNMGYHSSPPLAFLMTLFNVRLGRWFANPRKAHWKRRSPRNGMWHLLAELFGMSDADASYLHLSDGGHFENLGVYELVRRRCKLIVAVDASADGDQRFEDLGNAIRKCATDMNIDIDIDVGKIDLAQASEFSSAYCVVGKIGYSRIDPGAEDGTLLYIKPSLMGRESADVLNYRKTNKDFPHQSTADQWFDETQFESYRALGYRIGGIAFGKAAAASRKSGQDARKVADLCAALKREWSDDQNGVHLFQKRRQGNRRQGGG